MVSYLIEMIKAKMTINNSSVKRYSRYSEN